MILRGQLENLVKYEGVSGEYVRPAITQPLLEISQFLKFVWVLLLHWNKEISKIEEKFDF